MKKIGRMFLDLKEGILISLRALKVNKMRAVLTTLGIVIGIVAVTTMSTAIVGLRQAFIKSFSSLGQNVLYVSKFEWMGGKNWRYYRNRKNITYDQYLKLKKSLTNYEAIAPIQRAFGRTIKRKDLTATSSFIYGTTDQYIRIAEVMPENGRFINEMDMRSNSKVCVIGKDIADALFPNEDPINKEIKIKNIPIKVIGVLEKQGSGFFGTVSLDAQILMPLPVFYKIFGGKRKSLEIAVKVAEKSQVLDAREEIEAVMRTIRKVPPGKPNDFAINRQQIFEDVYDKTVGIIAIAGIVITALSLFVGAIGIMNIMFVSVTERTREIGIRKAIGAKTHAILLQFLSEATIICLIGGLIGLSISFPLSLLINQFMPTSMTPEVVALALLISFVVGIISGILPAKKAAKLNPVEALRYE